MDTAIITALGVVLAAALSALLTAWLTRKKSTAEVDQLKASADQLNAEVESLEVANAQKVVELVGGQFDSLTSEIEKLKLKVIDLENRLNESGADRRRLTEQVERLHAHIDALEALMRREGIDPPPRPRLYGGGGE